MCVGQKTTLPELVCEHAMGRAMNCEIVLYGVKQKYNLNRDLAIPSSFRMSWPVADRVPHLYTPEDVSRDLNRCEKSTPMFSWTSITPRGYT